MNTVYTMQKLYLLDGIVWKNSTKYVTESTVCIISSEIIYENKPFCKSPCIHLESKSLKWMQYFVNITKYKRINLYIIYKRQLVKKVNLFVAILITSRKLGCWHLYKISFLALSFLFQVQRVNKIWIKNLECIDYALFNVLRTFYKG